MELSRIVILLGIVAFARGITLDEFEVFLKEPPAVHSGDSYDLYGYTAVLHNLVDPATSSFNDIRINARIIIGVPNGTTMGQNSVDSTGYVTMCSLQDSTTECAPFTISGFPAANTGRLYDTSSNEADEDKAGQFLGISMDSRNGKFAVCAHKWKWRQIAQGSPRLVHGLCLVSPRQLNDFTILRPCTPKGTAGQDYNLLLQYNPSASGYGFCSSGTEISFTDDGSLIIGAPGSYLWKGAGFVYNGTSPVMSVTPEFSNTFGYIGMGTTQARITSRDTLEWVTGSPRAENYFGQILVYGFNPKELVAGEVEFSPPTHNIRGTKIGSYFGYTLAAVDFNNDGFDDVLVGAPLYFKASGLPEIGAVYIYDNQVTATTNRGTIISSAVFILEPPNGGVAYGRFGHAIKAMGDLNADGFNDVAISAPFGEGQSGTVYIYLGSQQGMMRTPSQTIVGSSLHLMPGLLTNLTSFGSSLSVGDIDGNGYSDLAIGAFGSRKVFAMRARSVATITANIVPSSTSFPIKVPKVCEFDPADNQTARDCFNITVCMSVSGQRFPNPSTIDVDYTLLADERPSGLQPRAQFASSFSSSISDTISLTVAAAPECFSHTLYILESAVQSDLQDVPIRPSISVSIDQGTPPAVGDGSVNLMTDLRSNRIFARVEGTTFAQVQGALACSGGGSNISLVCISDVVLSNFATRYMSRTDANYTGSELLVGVVTDIIFDASLENRGPDPAYSSEILFTHPSSLTVSRVESGSQLTCITNSGRTLTTCSIAGAVAQNSTLPISVRFVVLEGTVTGAEVSLSVIIQSQIAGEDPVPANNMYTYTVPVRSSISAAVTAAISNDQLTVLTNYSRTGLPRSLSELGRRVQIDFTVTNAGPSSIGQGRLTIRIPTRNPCTGNNAFLFYLASLTATDLGGSCSPDPLDSYDTLRLLSVANSSGILPVIPGACPTGTSETVRCTAISPGCVTVTCLLNSQTRVSSGTVSIVGYLDEAFLKDSSLRYTLVFSADYEVLDTNFNEDNTDNNRDEVSLQLNGGDTTGSPPAVEAWVIVVPIVVAVIFVVVLIIILWVCGFFKRKQKWKTQEENEGVDAGAATSSPEKNKEQEFQGEKNGTS
nr:integrin alpha 5 [Halisarca dujardinii]